MSNDRKGRFEWQSDDPVQVVTEADLKRIGIKPILAAPQKPLRGK